MKHTATAEEYARAFEAERAHEYPAIDAFEAAAGHKLDRKRLEEAARVLACPVKANPPNWQHGRVIYAAARRWLANAREAAFLDIGTAKGFSALCMAWAAADAGRRDATIISLDVVDPKARVARNTVADIDGCKTVAELVAPFWPSIHRHVFLGVAAADYLRQTPHAFGFAFVDGKHQHDAVAEEATLIGAKQQKGDIVIFDDIHIPGVGQAVAELKGYDIETIVILPARGYAVATKR